MKVRVERLSQSGDRRRPVLGEHVVDLLEDHLDAGAERLDGRAGIGGIDRATEVVEPREQILHDRQRLVLPDLFQLLPPAATRGVELGLGAQKLLVVHVALLRQSLQTGLLVLIRFGLFLTHFGLVLEILGAHRPLRLGHD